MSGPKLSLAQLYPRHARDDRHARVAAVVAVLITLGAIAAVGPTSPDRAAAQQVATPLQVVQNYAAPTLSAQVLNKGPQLNWQFNESTMTPPGWKLAGFSIARQIKGTRGTLTFFKAAASDRSYHDVYTGQVMDQWHQGNKYTYDIIAYYHRLSDDAEQVGKTSSEVTIRAAATMAEVKKGFAPTSMTAVAHADGVRLEWKFDEATMAPPGWRLSNFPWEIGRWVPGKPKDVATVMSHSKGNPKTRSFKDTNIASTPQAQRYPGFKWHYGIMAHFTPLSPGEGQRGTFLKINFTSPTIPAPRNVKHLGEGNYSLFSIRWNTPHLSWGTNQGFDGNYGYHVYRITSTDQYATCCTVDYGWGSDTKQYVYQTSGCWNNWWVRARAGIFFSDASKASDQRTGRCG